MSFKLSIFVGAFVTQAALTLGCPDTVSSRAKPEPEEMAVPCVEVPPADKQQENTRVRLEQGTNVAFGESYIGVAVVWEKQASLHIRPQAEEALYSLQMVVCEGEVVPIGAKFYQISSITRRSSVPNLPGASTGYVEMDSTPVVLSGIQLAHNSLAMVLGARAEISNNVTNGYHIETMELNASSAQLDVWRLGYAKNNLQSELKSHTVKGGETLNLNSQPLRVRSVTPSDSPSGLRGFVELEFI